MHHQTSVACGMGKLLLMPLSSQHLCICPRGCYSLEILLSLGEWTLGLAAGRPQKLQKFDCGLNATPYSKRVAHSFLPLT